MMEIRPYQPGDEKQILELFHISFGKPLSDAYWQWRFANQPEGKMMIMLMWDNERLVGHYAVSPVRMLIGGAEVLTSLSMTTMTHPEYSGRGIFTDLAESLYSEQKTKNQLAAVWGFPNHNSHYGFIKNVQWRNLEQIPTFSIEATLINHQESSIVIGSEFQRSHYESTLKNDFPVQVKRNASYLNWRYVENPIHQYVLFEHHEGDEMSFAVVKLFRSFSNPSKFEIDILEWELPADIKIQQQFLSFIKEHYSEHQPFRINMWVPLNDPKHIQLEKIGFRNQAPITYSGIRILRDGLDDMLKSEKWHYNLGYSDIY
ncbi:MAG: GNAT family N-acetyltransferase [Flavobacteriales bacterium]|nr:GNAT family N-acetyltransferase [Flavobacteriales bacterium]